MTNYYILLENDILPTATVMKEKFRLRCDLNEIHDIGEIDNVATAIENSSHIEPFHRYSYLFHGYHDLTHGKIDDETFFTIGDITSDKQVFSHARSAGLETVFMIEETHASDTLYIVEQGAWSYYLGKVGDEKAKAFHRMLDGHGSRILVV